VCACGDSSHVLKRSAELGVQPLNLALQPRDGVFCRFQLCTAGGGGQLQAQGS
jgi:hypothetical protein